MKRLALTVLLFVSLPTVCARADAGACQTALKGMRELVEELRGFEDSSSFAFYGFAGGGPHYTWMQKAEALRDRTSGSDFIGSIASDQVAVPGDIIGWGLEKMRCATRAGQCDHEFIGFVEGELRGMKCAPR